MDWVKEERKKGKDVYVVLSCVMSMSVRYPLLPYMGWLYITTERSGFRPAILQSSFEQPRDVVARFSMDLVQFYNLAIGWLRG